MCSAILYWGSPLAWSHIHWKDTFVCCYVLYASCDSIFLLCSFIYDTMIYLVMNVHYPFQLIFIYVIVAILGFLLPGIVRVMKALGCHPVWCTLNQSIFLLWSCFKYSKLNLGFKSEWHCGRPVVNLFLSQYINWKMFLWVVWFHARILHLVAFT
jgi:hypothetical protein